MNLPRSKQLSARLLVAFGALSLAACSAPRPTAETAVAPASILPSTTQSGTFEPATSPKPRQQPFSASTSVAPGPVPTTSIITSASPVTASEAVPPPARLVIDVLAIDVPLTRLGVMPDGALEVPANPDDVGWWRSLRHVGPTVIVGHVDSKTGPAVFYRLNKLAKGDRIVVNSETAGGPRAQTFVVRDLERVSKSRFPSSKVYQGAKGDLRLVTCGGEFNRRTGHYLDNVIVFATPTVSPA